MSFTSELKKALLKQKTWDQNSSYTQEEQIKRITVREAFIKSGSLTNPNKDYHLEISIDSTRKSRGAYGFTRRV